MYKNTQNTDKLKKIEEFTVEEATTSGVYFKGKFISAELLHEIKTKY